MNATSLAAAAARRGQWLASPTGGLGVTWIAILAVLVFWVRDNAALTAFLGLSFLVGWASMLVVAAAMPPPAKLSETSALAARVMNLVKVVWSAFAFAAGAVYGGMTGVALDTSGALFSADGGFSFMQALIWPLVGAVTIIGSWYAVMACAYDLWRAGEECRAQALNRVIGNLPPELSELRVTEWLREVVLACTRGLLPWALAYLAPTAVVLLLQILPGSLFSS